MAADGRSESASGTIQRFDSRTTGWGLNHECPAGAFVAGHFPHERSMGSDGGNKIRIVVKLALEFQETVVATGIAVRILAAHMRSRGIHRALALITIE